MISSRIRTHPAKSNLCNTLNKDAVRRRDVALEHAFHAAAMAVVRSRVVVVEDATAVKSFMGSAPKEGLKTKVMYVDCLLYTSPSPRDLSTSRMPSSA